MGEALDPDDLRRLGSDILKDLRVQDELSLYKAAIESEFTADQLKDTDTDEELAKKTRALYVRMLPAAAERVYGIIKHGKNEATVLRACEFATKQVVDPSRGAGDPMADFFDKIKQGVKD